MGLIHVTTTLRTSEKARKKYAAEFVVDTEGNRRAFATWLYLSGTRWRRSESQAPAGSSSCGEPG